MPDEILTLGRAPHGYVRVYAQLPRTVAEEKARELRAQGRAVCLALAPVGKDRWNVYAPAPPGALHCDRDRNCAEVDERYRAAGMKTPKHPNQRPYGAEDWQD